MIAANIAFNNLNVLLIGCQVLTFPCGKIVSFSYRIIFSFTFVIRQVSNSYFNDICYGDVILFSFTFRYTMSWRSLFYYPRWNPEYYDIRFYIFNHT